ncbi:MAG: TetR/AcrR family transcriptional regulator [Clostridia bacterium]|nr:TetR/AcrR family transcriptional regulator [Clostridia bacterium]
MDRRVKRTKEAIYTACLELLMEKEYNKITISEIARRADIDRKTFYLHYTCIGDVFAEYSKNKMAELDLRLKLKGFDTNPFDIRILFKELEQQCKENMDLFRHVAKSENYNEFWLNLDGYVVGSLEKFYMNKVSTDPVRLRRSCEFAVAGIKTLYRNWLMGKYEESLEELSEYMATVFDTHFISKISL